VAEWALQRDTDICDREAGVQRGYPTAKYKKCMLGRGWTFSHVTKSAPPRSSASVTVYDRDSKDPDVGWHWEGGMRVCRHDCENPEIPGSGYTCRDVQAFGTTMRECVR